MRSLFLLLLAACAFTLPACGEDVAQELESCSKDGDCASGLKCLDGVCMKQNARTSCLVDAQCPAGWKCVSGFCQGEDNPVVECSEELPCPEGQECVNGACETPRVEPDVVERPECTQDEDCEEGFHCSDDQCVEDEPVVECESDDDCEEGSCDTEQGICVVEEPECTTDEDCESGLCDTGAGECIENAADCTTADDCSDDDPCTEDTCQEGKCKNVHVVNEECCTKDEHCPAPADPCVAVACEEYHCVETPIEDCCTENAQCDDGNAMTQDLCVENVCTNPGIACIYDADCDDGNPCTIDTCKAQECQNVVSADPLCCATDADCDDLNDETEDVCIDFQCVFKSDSCETDGDCVDSNPCTTEKCNQGVCEVDIVTEPQCECVNDLDCAGKGNTCSLVQTGPSTAGTWCGNPVGEKLAGEVCTKDDDCKGGFCASFNDGDICFGGCKSDADCHGTSECGTVNFTMAGDVTVVFPACIFPPDFCDGEADCPEDQFCLPGLHPDDDNTLVGFCNEGIGPKTPGSICAADDDCATGICFDLIEKGIHICWSTCQNDADCLPGLKCYENLSYFLFDQETPDLNDDTYFSMPVCTPDLGSFKNCLSDSQCPGNEFCSTYTNYNMTALEPKCVSAKGSTGAGGSCTADSQCKSNWCNSPPGFCVGLCQGDGDCYNGTTCEIIDFTVNAKGDEVPAHVCLP